MSAPKIHFAKTIPVPNDVFERKTACGKLMDGLYVVVDATMPTSEVTCVPCKRVLIRRKSHPEPPRGA